MQRLRDLCDGTYLESSRDPRVKWQTVASDVRRKQAKRLAASGAKKSATRSNALAQVCFKSDPEPEEDAPPSPNIIPFLLWVLLTAVLVLVCVYGLASLFSMGGLSVAAAGINHGIMSLFIHMNWVAPGTLMPWGIPLAFGAFSGLFALSSGCMACLSLYHFVRDTVAWIKDETKSENITAPRLLKRKSRLSLKSHTIDNESNPEDRFCYRLWLCSDSSEEASPVARTSSYRPYHRHR